MTPTPNESTGSFVTQGQFFEAHQQILDRMDEQHRRIRETVETALSSIGTKFDDHNRDIHTIDMRVKGIETAREVEEKQAIRMTALLSTLMAAFVVGLKTLITALLSK